MDTDFDKLVTGSKTNEEKRPMFFSQMHGIPKQIADSSNAIGVNERTLKNGLMSGVMQPSQIAHDRWLSIYDGAFDSFVFFCCFYGISVFGINLYVVGMVIVFYIYMFFHFFWWEHSMQWYFIETIRDYVNNTKRFYYWTLITSFVLFTSVGFYYSIKYDFIGKVNMIYSYTSNATKGSKSFITLKKHEPSAFDKNVNEFDTKKIVSEVEQKKEEKIEEIKEEPHKKIITSEVILNFIIYNLLHIIVMIYIYKVSMNYYKNKRDVNIKGTDSELTSELEQKMFKLRDV